VLANKHICLLGCSLEIVEVYTVGRRENCCNCFIITNSFFTILFCSVPIFNV